MRSAAERCSNHRLGRAAVGITAMMSVTVVNLGVEVVEATAVQGAVGASMASITAILAEEIAVAEETTLETMSSRMKVFRANERARQRDEVLMEASHRRADNMKSVREILILGLILGSVGKETVVHHDVVAADLRAGRETTITEEMKRSLRVAAQTPVLTVAERKVVVRPPRVMMTKFFTSEY